MYSDSKQFKTKNSPAHKDRLTGKRFSHNTICGHIMTLNMKVFVTILVVIVEQS